MVKLFKINIIIGTVLFLASCATSMSPAKVNDTLPKLTKSEFFSASQVEEAIKSERCKFLVKGRKYTAPMALTTEWDLRNGAKGIDEWVELDGGNAYSLVSYQWITVDHMGSTQLHVEFDTMICELSPSIPLINYTIKRDSLRH